MNRRIRQLRPEAIVVVGAVEAAGKSDQINPREDEADPHQDSQHREQTKGLHRQDDQARIKVMIPLAKPQRQPSTSW